MHLPVFKVLPCSRCRGKQPTAVYKRRMLIDIEHTSFGIAVAADRYHQYPRSYAFLDGEGTSPGVQLCLPVVLHHRSNIYQRSTVSDRL